MTAPRILFVQGFLSDTQPSYKTLEPILGQNTTFFSYSAYERLADIQARLWLVYQKNPPYDLLIGHSMGCFLLTWLLQQVSSPTKLHVIFLMPFLSTSGLTRISTYVPTPLRDFCYFPVSLVAPKIQLTTCPDPTRELTREQSLVPIQLVIDVTKKMDLTTFLPVYAAHHVTIIYGKLDTLTVLTPAELSRLKRVTRQLVLLPNAKHTPWNDCLFIREECFTALAQAIDAHIKLPSQRTKPLRRVTYDSTPEGWWCC